MDRFRNTMAFLILWLAAWIFWAFLIRAWAGHHADNPAVSGLASVTTA